MPTYYCTSSKCGKPIKYEALKPSFCPFCKANLNDRFIPTVAKVIGDIDEIATEPLEKSTISNIFRKKVKTISERSITKDEEIFHDSPDHYDKREAKRLAREIAASIDPSTISITNEGGDDDEPVNFGKLWEAGKATRESSSKKSKK